MSREELLSKCLKYFLQHGVAALSLRPLAAAVGTSARMLVHHFGSKEELIGAVMSQVRDKLQSMLGTLATTPDRNAACIMLGFWQLATTRGNLPYFRLLLEVQVLAIQNPRRYGTYIQNTSTSWLALVSSAIPPERGRIAMATLYTAVIDGLILELLSTGDARRTLSALNLFAQWCDNLPRSARNQRRSKRRFS